MAEIFSFGGRGCFLYFAWKESLLPCCVNGHKEQAGNL